MWEKKSEYTVLVGKLKGKRPLGRSGLAWEIILKWILEEWSGMGWIHLAQHRTSGGFL
jgi:hypothetical protein